MLILIIQDRILYRNKVETEAIDYTSCSDLNHSDHRPVFGIFRIQLNPLIYSNIP